MKSFALLRTNVGLTTNIKIMVDSNYNLTLDSIDSKEELENSKYKKKSFIKTNYFDELISYFYNGLPSETAFHIKFEEDVDAMATDFTHQYDELYQYGARNITNNKNYAEEFEYFAPLYIYPNKLPKYFIIFRVDGPGMITLNSSNFKNEILNKLKTIKIFDLTKKSQLGEWLDTNFNNNNFFPIAPLDVSFENLEFTKWNGIDYESGGYTSKSAFLEDLYESEKEIFEFEKYIFDGYRNNKVVFPNILNMSFLFDDTPANENNLRKWSINRYFGFYLDDFIPVKTISPYILPPLKADVVIETGNFLSSSSEDPFLNGFSDVNIHYVEYLGEYYPVEKVTEIGEKKLTRTRGGRVVTESFQNQTITRYKIISDLNLTGKQSMINKNIGSIDSSKRLVNYDSTYFQIEDWDKADVWIIEIDGKLHNLIKDTDGAIKIYSDYGFEIRDADYSYWINKSDPSYETKVSFVVDRNNPPKKFVIYKLNFTDIKDFDDRIVDTEYSKYEYENRYELSTTEETKMYLPNLFSKTEPKDIDDFTYRNKVVNIPVSSEYTANFETFKIENGELSDIWRKNPIYCRWGFQWSNSANDLPYLLNNSVQFEDFNRTANIFDPDPKRIERNLDYFYTINADNNSYIHHTLHVEDFTPTKIINEEFEFELDKYLNLGTYSTGSGYATYSYDYFSYFFDRKAYFENSNLSKNVKKYSAFGKGDDSIPNMTLFKGMKFYIYDIENQNPSAIKKDDTGKLATINLSNSNRFEDYKFSILLTDNELSVTDTGGITSSVNLMTWKIFDEWKMDKEYEIGDLVLMDSIIYKSSVTKNITRNPVKFYENYENIKSAPYNQPNWVAQNIPYSIFYSPAKSYPDDAYDYSEDWPSPGIVFNHQDYYYYTGGDDDFWNPITSDSVGYGNGVTVLFQGQYYMSMTASNRRRPDHNNPFFNGTNYQYYWTATQSDSPRWTEIQLWNPSKSYPSISGATYVVHEDIVYKTKETSSYGSDTGNEPGVSDDWERVYSLKPDTTIVYNENTNPIIELNDYYYYCESNTTNSTLECGINIYINKKWKNVLININISDNTTLALSNTNRDGLYSELNRKLTAANFMKCINDLSIKYGFTDFVNYIIIDESGNISKYNYDNIEGLPHIIFCEGPEEVTMKTNSLSWKPIVLPKELKPTKLLKSISNDLSNLNTYNGGPVAVEIGPNKLQAKPVKAIHGVQNILDDVIYRFSGFYMPVFYEIQLFSKDYFSASTIGNFKFDTELTEFGIAKERKIRKINSNRSLLKLGENPSIKSIYPMIDEFGYTFVDSFIFKSTADLEYHYSTEENIEQMIYQPPTSVGNSVDVGQVTTENKDL